MKTGRNEHWGTGRALDKADVFMRGKYHERIA